MPTTEAQRRATEKYQREKVKRVTLKLYPKDRDVVAWLETVPNRNGYLLNLIRDDMNRTA